jgi:hypothetical protein
MYPENPQEDTAAAEDFLATMTFLISSGAVWRVTSNLRASQLIAAIYMYCPECILVTTDFFYPQFLFGPCPISTVGNS